MAAKHQPEAPRHQHPRSKLLADCIARCRPVAWTGRLIRVVNIDYASTGDLLSGEGSLRFGGRYNARSGFRAIYASLELDTATAELLAHHRRQGRPDADADVFPFVAVSLETDVKRLLDLTDAAVRRVIKVKLKDLAGDWQRTQKRGHEAASQAIGRLARAAGFQGLIAPSAAKRGGHNLVLFRDAVSAGQLRIVRADALPKKT